MSNKQTLNKQTVTIDGNEAAAYVAHKTNEVIAIYPITPSSAMGEHADAWSAEGEANIWGNVPLIVEMQSEAGAAGTVHGALQAGSLTTTFTASQGLLLMIPNMYKIAGELTPTVFHVAARSLAAQALSIFADHSDVMATRATGFALLASNSVQEVADFALITQAATLKSRVPMIHFFDGFRTSHEMSKVEQLSDSVIESMMDDELIAAHRSRCLSPDHPVIRGTSQNPDVYFQARETVNPYYDRLPAILQASMDQFAGLTGRQYQLYEYTGSPEADRMIIVMGSAAETVHETVDHLCKHGESVGLLKVRLYRPFSAALLINAIPKTVKKIAVLDRTKEPGAGGEPLYKDVCSAMFEHYATNLGEPERMPKVIGGRFGLSSKEFTPGMVKSIYEEIAKPKPKNHFTVGIYDDVGNTNLLWDESFRTDANHENFEAVFYGLGSDGTVSANKNSIKIIGENTDLHAQGYFVYDSKKSGAVTISHLRFGQNPIRSSYLIGSNDAQYVACHQTVFLEKYDMLDMAADNSVFLLNSSALPDVAWESIPPKMQQQIITKKVRFFVIDAYKVARENGMGRRINTIMQTCFFAISGVVPKDEAIASIKQAVEKSYGKKGKRIVQTNFQAIDATLEELHEIDVPKGALVTRATSDISSQENAGKIVSENHDWTYPENTSLAANDFVQRVTAEIVAGRGDRIPVSQLPADGTFPLGTASIEKRNLALEIPVWEEDLCTHCGKCPFVCPHGAIRSKAFSEDLTANAPETFKHVQIKGKDYPQGVHISYQVAPEDCTGCGLCVDICPIRDKRKANRKALNMAPQKPLRAQERENWSFFMGLPDYDRKETKMNTMKGSMLLETLFEFSGACSGCGETPYVKLASQLFGDRMLVANATGCSSIYGGNLPTTPWSANAEGRGPAWSNSLFEDNAEFGLGMRLACDNQKEFAVSLLGQLNAQLDTALVERLLQADESTEVGIQEQRDRVKQLRVDLAAIDSPVARRLESVADNLCKRSVWIMGGDGWAYDIGYGGLDHVMASGKNINILVLDTEVYSNTGGQTSKATPRGAVAKFSASGKATAKKDLARIAMAYENIYVAHVAYGAKDVQTLNAFIDAESYEGVSLIIAYSPCIAHGFDMIDNHKQQQLAVNTGHWPLFRFDPRKAEKGINPLHLDSKPPSIPYSEFVKSEARFSMLWRSHPDVAQQLLKEAQHEVGERFDRYEQLSKLEWEVDEPSVSNTDMKNTEVRDASVTTVGMKNSAKKRSVITDKKGEV